MKNILALVFLFLFFANNFALGEKNAYQFSLEKQNGEKINFSDYKGKVILVVNTASKCGFTPQFVSLEKLYNKYKDRGFVIIAVPSADFGNQEFESTQDTLDFIDKNFKITFQVAKINTVVGKNACDFYKWANEKAGFFGSPKWNFHKYLIDRDGNFAGWFSSTTEPTSSKMESRIEELLN